MFWNTWDSEFLILGIKLRYADFWLNIASQSKLPILSVSEKIALLWKTLYTRILGCIRIRIHKGVQFVSKYAMDFSIVSEVVYPHVYKWIHMYTNGYKRVHVRNRKE
jgi:hypothetical protein